MEVKRLPDHLKDGSAETFRDCLIAIEATVRRFCFRYHLDALDSLCEAHEVFMDAYISYDPRRGSFLVWLQFRVWKRLLELSRRLSMRNARLPKKQIVIEHITTIPPQQQRDWLCDFLDLLTDDEQMVVHLVLDPPLEVLLSIKQQDGERTAWQVKTLLALEEYLTDIGWNWRRIDAAFCGITLELTHHVRFAKKTSRERCLQKPNRYFRDPQLT